MTSANALSCFWLHFDSASSSIHKRSPSPNPLSTTKKHPLPTDATNFTFNKDSAVLLKTYSEKIIPNVKASCVVGADALRGILLASIAQFVYKEIKAFGTRTEAINWLSSQ